MKRTKIILALSTCVLCLGMLAFSVYAALSSTIFNLNGTINFNPEGAYVDIEGKVLRGSSRTDLEELTGDNFTYKDKNYDDSTGITSGNFTMASWSPEVAFLPTERFIQYQVTITNKSSEPISAIPSDLNAITDVTALEEVSAVLRIDPNETKTYKLTLESTGDTAITDAQVNLNFDIRTTSAYIEEQTELKGVTFGITDTGYDFYITSVQGDNSTSSSPSLQKSLFIPKTVDDKTIDSFTTGSGASISLSTAIKYVIFEDEILVGDYIFRSNRSLKSVRLPNGIIYIPNSFTACSSLESVEIPEGVTSIAGNAFSSCSSLVSITIPSSVTSIGEQAFAGCSSLQITVAEDNVNYSSNKGILYNKNKTTLLSIAGGRVEDILDTATSIGSYAFAYSDLTTIALPDSVTSIGYCAFTDSTKLSSVTIPSSVTSIAYAAFFRCTSLTSFTMNTKEGYVWKKDNGSTWEIVDVSDPIQNATWFRSDPYYYNYAWSQGPSN